MPLVLSKLSASAIREDCIRFCLDESLDYLSETEKDDNHVFALQRQLRGSTVQQFLELQKREGIQTVPGLIMGSSNVLSDLVHYSTQHRVRKTISQRQSKTLAVEDRRRREVEERKRRKQSDYMKAVLDHREKFLTFHKDMKSGKKQMCLLVDEPSDVGTF